MKYLVFVLLTAAVVASAPAEARKRVQSCIWTANGQMICQGAPQYYVPSDVRRPGYRALDRNPYRVGTPSSPYNQPVQ